MSDNLTLSDRIRLGLSLKDHFEKYAPPIFSDADYYKRPRTLHTIGNRSQYLSAWAKEYGTSIDTVRARMHRGMSLECALDPTRMRAGRSQIVITLNGRTQTFQQWAAELGLSSATLSRRLSNPEWTLERALTAPRYKRGKAK